MGVQRHLRKATKNGLIKEILQESSYTDQNTDASYSQAIVPTIDIYTAKILFNLTQKMVEDAVDRRVSILEKHIKERDKELMRNIRKIQAQTVILKNKTQQPWWRRLFNQGK
ncbi:MAG: hypothetical protein A4E55_01876 [Pelotomaculum sp. PtaU1.Bin035]|nr:MAG: hypothetical protein A4E55_01876 [Pelotomaculum sp. PtaU1.Bin035]